MGREKNAQGTDRAFGELMVKGFNDRENQAETESLYSVLPLVALFLAAAES